MLVTQVKKKIIYRRIEFKLSDSERQVIQANADQYAEGNISEWVRFAAMNHKPLKSHLVPSKPRKKK